MTEINAGGGLRWVKGEIDSTLRRVRDAVDAYGDAADPAGLSNAVDALFEVRGVLLALQLAMPARLVDEMRRLCESIAEGSVPDGKEAAEAMTLALIQLTSYLDRVDAGTSDAPLGLWPTINDLRATRGAEPLSQAELLVPGSVLVGEGEDLSPEAMQALTSVLRKVRPLFHKHLVQWYRGASPDQGLNNLAQLFQQLHRYLHEGVLSDLFRLAEAFLGALQRGRLESGAAERALIGRLDRVLKPLAQPAPEWPEDESKALIDALLDTLARDQGAPPVVAELRALYRRSREGDGSVAGTSGDLTRLATRALRELEALKEQFERYAHGDRHDHAPPEALRKSLMLLADSLDPGPDDGLADRMRELADGFGDLAAAEDDTDALRLEFLAAQLLSIEATLKGFAGERMPVIGLGSSADPYGADLSASTLREVCEELISIKNAIIAWREAGAPQAGLSGAVGKFRSVAGALQILGEDSAARLTDELASVVRACDLGDAGCSGETGFEHLADAIAALELYVERLAEGLTPGEDLIARARRALSELRGLASEASARSLGLMAEPGPSDGSGADDDASIADLSAEFMEIFLEEASESIDSIRTQHGRWQTDPDDTAALAELRRSFHTLKGSGRLVGAERVGDFAEAVERVLNRLIEGSLRPSEELGAFLAETVAVLPDLVSAEAEGRPLSVDGLIARAAAWRSDQPAQPPEPAEHADASSPERGILIPWPGTPSQSQPTAGSDDAEAADRDSLFAADEELLAIFRSETDEHLADLRGFLTRAHAGDAVPDESAIRALHTLAGSARMAGVQSIADVAKSLEQQVRPAQEAGRPLTPGLVGLLERAVDGIAIRAAEMPAAGEGTAVLRALSLELAAPQTSVQTVEPVPRVDEHQVEELLSRAPTMPELGAGAAEPPPVSAPHSTSGSGAEFAAGPEGGLEPTSAEVEPAPEPLAPESAGRKRTGKKRPGRKAAGQVPAAPSTPAPKVTEREPTPAEPTIPVAAEADDGDFEAPPADSDLAGLFLEEAHDLLDGIDAGLRQWQLAPRELSALDGINRMLHTLKGGARLTGLRAIGDLAHALETRLTVMGSSAAGVDDTTLELAQRAVDTLALQVDALEHGAPIPRVSALVSALNQESVTGAPSAPELAVMRPAAEPSPAPAVPAMPPPADARKQDREAAQPAAGGPQIRVRSELLDRLVDNAGEISLYRARLSQRNGLMGFGLGELDQTLTRLREKLRLLEIETETQILHRFEREGIRGGDEGGFDPLELDRFSNLQQVSRSLAETVNDLIGLKDILTGYQRESADLLTQQARLAEHLQDGLLRTRMVPFVQVVPRLHRLVRQTADSLGKSARLEVVGPEVELDRSILDRLVAPLEHLLRNAVDHGLEGAEARRAAGKKGTGVVTLTLNREGNDVVIVVSDDGRGMNLEAIREQAVARGLLGPDVRIADEALMQFVLEPGFTTAGRVTQISGRGVGLDVVASEIKAANGAISLDSVPGRGSSFSIRLPLTLAIIEAFLVGVGDRIYAVPHATIEGAARIGREELAALYRGKGRDFEYRGHPCRVAYLGGVLDPRQEPDLGEKRWLPLLMVRLGDERVALQVDSLIGSERIVVKPLGPQLAGIRWLSGGTILPDGRVALIVDALALLRSGAAQGYAPAARPGAGGEAPRCVLVVDDSLTVRKVTGRLLKRQHFDVLTAKDGVEALTLLDERLPDLMLLDIEMPRMDGYELTRHIRRSERMRDLPIIMITSRAGQKHRDHAMELGVNRYLSKPFQESELLHEIGSVLAERSA